MSHIVMTNPDHYEVFYTINPWMRPDEWAADPIGSRRAAQAKWTALANRLRAAGMTIEEAPGAAGLPDMVFPANAAIVLDGKALLARFRHPQRQGEEPLFRRFFDGLKARGLLAAVSTLPDGVYQEGAGDCIWDPTRQLFWAGYGPRSHPAALAHIRRCFGQAVVGLELVTDHFYHLDTCFCALAGGEVLYYPEAFSPAGRALVEEAVADDLRIAATRDEAAAFSLNAVNIGRDLIMAPPPARLRGILEERGYRCLPVDLSSFMISGGGAYCMTLRLDLASRAGLSAAVA
jgi:N-dimethylarginine dimethylaminohydrolase